ncbi:MAG: alpha/beta fold hydrolase [Pseudobdellovibrionaceae bacterium]
MAKILRKAFLWALGGSLILYFSFIGLLFIKQRDLLYFPPPQSMYLGLEEKYPDYVPVNVRTTDGLTLQGYFVAPRDGQKPVILAFHGNGSHSLWLANNFAGLVEDGYGVLLAEYRGYGGNEGHPSEEGLYQDAEAYFSFLRDNPDSVQNPLILYGQSLGSGVAVELAFRHKTEVNSLILEVPFLSVPDTVKRVYPFVPFPELLVTDRYRSDEKIGKIEVPVLFLLAEQDEIVGLEGGKSLYGLANEPKTLKIYPRAYHMTVFNAGAREDLDDFVRGRVE